MSLGYGNFLQIIFSLEHEKKRKKNENDQGFSII